MIAIFIEEFQKVHAPEQSDAVVDIYQSFLWSFGEKYTLKNGLERGFSARSAEPKIFNYICNTGKKHFNAKKFSAYDPKNQKKILISACTNLLCALIEFALKKNLEKMIF